MATWNDLSPVTTSYKMGGDKHRDLQVLSNLRMMLMYFNVIS